MPVTEFFHITTCENLSSILERGILSHQKLQDEGIDSRKLYEEGIVKIRKDILANKKSLWEYANLYLRVNNPMMYKRRNEPNVIVLGISHDVISTQGAIISDGNAAVHGTCFFSVIDELAVRSKISASMNKPWWNDEDGSKREVMAELLVPIYVDKSFIRTIYVPDRAMYDKVLSQFSGLLQKIRVVIQPAFFKPRRHIVMNKFVSILEGDMFFSDLQMLTVSVNTVGVMGAGVAARAKYQFPWLYVQYQDLCKHGVLDVNRPCIVSTEVSLQEKLLGEVDNSSKNTKFLLFATKKHWKNPSQLAWIESGLKEVLKNKDVWKLESLAIPALGCGLGKLSWKDVGPIMVKYLSALNIPVEIYLPMEHDIEEKWLTKEFLLGGERQSTL